MYMHINFGVKKKYCPLLKQLLCSKQRLERNCLSSNYFN